MKKTVLLLAITGTLLFGGTNNPFSSSVEDSTQSEIKLCKFYVAKAKDYMESGKKHIYASATLASYRKNVVTHCGPISSKSSPSSILTASR
jgi:hypothetical protein